MVAERRVRDFFFCALLALSTVAVFWPLRDAGYIDLDDRWYVSNPMIRRGLSLESVRWAFGSLFFANWIPLTSLSYMLDVQLFGSNPGAQHLVNVAFHAANAVLLFLLLRATTRSLWGSAVVAALFAVHPLHVESVAWIAERKDVLSTLFWLLTTLTWVGYVRSGRRVQYLGSLVLFAAGLMSKPMLVTLPFTLLLLDVWPLERLRLGVSPRGTGRGRLGPGKLIAEKLPLFALSLVAGVIALVAQADVGATQAIDLGLSARLANALVAYVAYIGATFWPFDLAIFYPHPGHWSAWIVLGAVAVVLGVSLLAVKTIRQYPFFAVGWFWYLGTLVPVIGLVQVGTQWMADRYTYVPLIGVFIALTWSAITLAERLPWMRVALAGLGIGAVALSAWVANAQTAYWRDSETLFRRAIAVTEGNYLAYSALGTLRDRAGDTDGAIEHYETALRLKADHPMALYNLSVVLIRLRRFDEALRYFEKLADLYSDRAVLQSKVGELRATLGDFRGSAAAYRKAVHLDPNDSVTRANLGTALLASGRESEGASELEIALRLDPDNREAARRLIGVRAASADPGLRDARQALALASSLLSQDAPTAADFYAVALANASAGRSEEAARAAQRSAELARASNDPQLAAQAEALAGLQ